MVVAESIAAAKDAAERVDVDYEPLPAVTETLGRGASRTRRLYDHTAQCLHRRRCRRRRRRPRRRSRAPPHVAKFDTWVQRVTGVPIEPRAAVGVYDKATGKLHPARRLGRRGAAEARARRDPRRAGETTCGSCAATSAAISAPATPSIPEFALVVWAAKRLGRPVKWTCDRRKPSSATIRAAIWRRRWSWRSTRDGKFLALRGSNISNIGAHA